MAFLPLILPAMGAAMGVGTTAAAVGATAATVAAASAMGVATVSAGVGLIGTGMSAYSTIQQGKSARSAANFQAQQEENAATVAGYQAIREGQQAQREAEQISGQRERVLGQQVAAASASGLTVSGSVTSVLEDTSLQVENDIAMAKYRGEVGAWNSAGQAKSLMTQASMTRVAGKNAYKSAKWAALGSVAQGVARAGSSLSGAYSATSLNPSAARYGRISGPMYNSRT